MSGRYWDSGREGGSDEVMRWGGRAEAPGFKAGGGVDRIG